MSSELLDRLWGCGDLDQLFAGGADRTATPWRQAGRPKNESRFDHDAVVSMLNQPVNLVEFDPREVWAHQPGIVRHHVRYYTTGQWEVSGHTSADHFKEANRFPVIVPDYRGRPLILSGHHRTAAALIEGRPVRARVAALNAAFHVTPNLRVDPAVGAIDDASAAHLLSDEGLVTVPDLAAARAVLRVAGVPADHIALAVDRAEGRLAALSERKQK